MSFESALTSWERVGSRDNALNIIRFVLACSVLVSHSFSLTGHAHEPAWAGLNLGRWAVAGFFCLSGYLITGSRLRTEMAPYLWRRILRIFPAYWAGLLFVALVASPLSTVLADGQWHPKSAVHFLLRNGMLYFAQSGIERTIAHVPFPLAWNGSMWTLIYEVGAYLVVAALFIPSFTRRHPLPLTMSVLVLVTALSVGAGNGLSALALGAQLGSFFAAGAVLCCARSVLPLNHVAATIALGALLVLWVFPVEVPPCFAALPLAYALLWLGSVLPVRWFSRNDLSYGAYVFAFPAQQLVASGTSTHSVAVMVAWAFPVTLVCAALSWFFIEKRALRLARLVPGRGQRSEGASPA